MQYFLSVLLLAGGVLISSCSGTTNSGRQASEPTASTPILVNGNTTPFTAGAVTERLDSTLDITFFRLRFDVHERTGGREGLTFSQIPQRPGTYPIRHTENGPTVLLTQRDQDRLAKTFISGSADNYLQLEREQDRYRASFSVLLTHREAGGLDSVHFAGHNILLPAPIRPDAIGANE